MRGKWIRRTLIGILIVGILAAGGAYLLGVRVTVNPAARLADAHARWNAQDIDDYRLLVRVDAPFATSGVYQIDVENGTPTDTRIYSPGTFRMDPNAPAFEVAPSQGEAYTVAALFGRAERLVNDVPWLHLYMPHSTHVRYSETGHVAELVDNACGWALTLVDECVTRITVQRLEPSAR